MKFSELQIDQWFRIGDERMIFAKRDNRQFRIVGGPYEHFEADPDMEVKPWNLTVENAAELLEESN